VLHDSDNRNGFGVNPFDDDDDDAISLIFTEPDEEQDQIYRDSQKLLFGDYNYPCIDVSGDIARQEMWDEEERILRDQRAAAFLGPAAASLASPTSGAKAKLLDGTDVKVRSGLFGYGATGETPGAKGKQVERNSRAVYGGWGEDQDTTLRYGRVETEGPQQSNAVIDMSGQEIPDIVVDGVRLQYTKSGAVHPISPKRSRPSTPKNGKSRNSRDGLGVTIPSGVLQTTEYPGPERAISAVLKKSSASQLSSAHPKLSPRPSSNFSKSSPVSGDPSLPSDAVDLVVEDHQAEQEEMAHERRKGEPAVRQTGLRKIYKRGYVVEDEEGEEKQAEVRVEREENVEGVSPTEKTKVTIWGQNGSSEDVNGDDGSPSSPWIEEAEVTIAQSTTPPPHATLEVDQHAYHSPRLPPPNDDFNPWA
jgi:hypothetical protein